MTSMYVSQDWAVVKKVSKRILVEQNEKVLAEVPVLKISHLLLFGNIQVTADAADLLLKNGVTISLFSGSGRLKAKIDGYAGKNTVLRLKQFQRYTEPEFVLNFVRTIVSAKIKNEIAFIHRYQRNHPESEFTESLAALEQYLESLAHKTRVESVRGIEGISTATYFNAYGKMFRQELQFTQRTRRPPKDPVNALLSLGYTLVGNELRALVEGSSLDAGIGYLHEVAYGRPSLALDLLEEFRVIIVDRFTLRLMNLEEVKSSDFTRVGGGVMLTDEARKEYFRKYEEYLTHKFEYQGKETTFRELFHKQVLSLMKTISDEQSYKPILRD